MKFTLPLIAVLAHLTLSIAVAAPSLQLTLPKSCYAAPGVPFSIYYDNVVLTQTPEDFRFEITCDVGRAESKRWTVTPDAKDAGPHPLSIVVKDRSGKVLEEAKTVLHIAPWNAGAERSLRLLLVGASITQATIYPNEIARLLSTPGNPRWTILGTHKRPNAAPGVVHEGYGGWTWKSFFSLYSPEAARTAAGPLTKRNSSPFVFTDVNGRGDLDIARYIREECDQQAPDVVTFSLGINDTFAANPENPAAIDKTIDAVMENAEKLLQAFRTACPNAALGVALPTPPNARESGFVASYKGKYHRWGWKRIQHRLVQRMLIQFNGREAENIYVIPAQLNIDPVSGYPEDNGVHPNAAGYQQLGGSFYAWLKDWLHLHAR